MNRTSRRLLPALAFTALAVLAGCAEGPYRDGSYRRGGQPVTRNDVMQAQDSATAARVRQALASDVRVGAETLTVRVVDGVAEISGSPKDLRARDLALRIAGRVPGVRTVLNNMSFN